MGDAPSDAQRRNIGTRQTELRTICAQYKITDHVQSELSRLGYQSADMFSTLYTDEDNLAADAPTELTFGPTDPDFNPETSKRERIRLTLAWNHAKTLREHRHKLMTSNTQEDDIRLLVQGSIRASAEEVWRTKHCSKPPLEDQGTDAFLARIYKGMGSGNIGVYQQRQRVERLDNHTKTTTRKRDSDGSIEETEMEEAVPPTTLQELRHQTTVLSTSIVMVSYVLPTIPVIQITKQDLDEYYNWFFGPEIAGRTPAPPLRVLENADLAAWRRIAIELHRGRDVKQALKDTKADAPFWQRDVYEKTLKGGSYNQSYGKGDQGYQRNQNQGWQKGEFYGQYGGGYNQSGKNAKGKGKKGKNNKGKTGNNDKGKGKGKTTTFNNPPVSDALRGNWADKGPATSWHPEGQKICRSFHTGACWGGCGASQSHCPRMLSSGRHCFLNHKAFTCTQT